MASRRSKKSEPAQAEVEAPDLGGDGETTGIDTVADAPIFDDAEMPTGEVDIPPELKADEAFDVVRGEGGNDPEGASTVKVPSLTARGGKAKGKAGGKDKKGAAPAEPEPEPPEAALARQCDTLLERGLEPSVALDALTALERGAATARGRAVVQRAMSRAHEEAGDRDRAFFARVRAARLSPPDREQLDELFRLAVLTGAYAELADVYESALTGALPPADRIYVHLKLGHLYGRELARPQAAVAHYRRVATVDSDNVEALHRLGEILGRTGRWQDAADAKQAELEALWRTTHDVGRVASLKRELARLYEERLDDRAKALVHYRELLELTPGNAAALASLERISDAVPAGEGVAEQTFETLRDLYGKQGAYARLADLLSGRAKTMVGEGRILEGVTLHREAADVYETRLEDPGRAFIEVVRAIQTLPQGEAVKARGLFAEDVSLATNNLLESLLRTGRASHGHAQLAAVAEDLARKIGGEAGAAILVRLAEIDVEDLGESGRAAERLARAVELSGDDPALGARLEGLYVERGAWRELAEFYRARADRTDDPAAHTDLLFRLAELLETELADNAAAVRVYEEIIERRGGDAQALSALCRIHEAARNWPALVDALERAVSGATDLEAKKAALLERAKVSFEHLKDPRAARGDWQRVLALDPQSAPALQGLADTTEEVGDARETAQALEKSLESMRPGEPDRADGYRRLARLYDGALGKPARARLAWDEVLAEDPSDVEAFTRLRAIHHARGDAEALATLLSRRLEATPRDPEAKRWRRELIDALEDLGRGDEAGAEWARAVDADAGDLEALEQLAAFHTARRSWKELVATLRRWIDAAPGRPEKADLHVRIGNVLRHQVDDTKGAVAAYERALVLVPDHAGAADALLELYRESGEMEKAFPLMGRSVARLADPRDRASALTEVFEVGRMLGEKGDAEAAKRSFEALEEACLLAPGNEKLWDELESRLGGQDDASRLAGLLEARAARLDAGERARALLKAAEAWRRAAGPDDLRMRERVQRCLERARDCAEPGDAIVAEVLGLLRAAYTAAGAWEALAAVLEDLADPAHTPDPEARRLLVEELADILEDRLGRPDEAADWFDRLIALPATPAERDRQLAHQMELSGRLGDWRRALDALEERIRLARGTSKEPELRRTAAAIAERRIDDPERAVAHLRAALLQLPDDDDLLHDLERAAGVGRRFAELAATLTEVATLTTAPERRARLLVQAATVKEERLGDLAGARRDLESVVEMDAVPDEIAEAAVGGLARILSASRSFGELAQLYEGLVERETESEVKADLALMLGLVYEEQLEDPGRALAAYRTALDADPESTAALDALARLAEAGDDLDTAIDLRRRQAELVTSPEMRSRLSTDIGRLAEARGDADAALDAYRRAAEQGQGAMPPRRALLRLLRATGSADEILACARELAGITPDERERADLLTEVGDLLEAGGDDAGAQEAYEAAVAAVPEHPAAAAALAPLLLARDEAGRAASLLEVAARHLSPEVDGEVLAEVQRQRSIAAEALGDDAAAARHLDEAVRLGPLRRSTLEGLATLLERRGDPARAHETLRTIIELYDHEIDPPGRVRLLERMGSCLSALGRPGDAASLLDEALEIAPHDRGILSALAKVYAATGRYGEVVELKQRIREDTRDPEERRRLDLEIAALWADRLHDASRAALVLESALETNPDDPEILAALAREEEKRGRFGEAAGSLRRLLGLTGDPDEAARIETRLGHLFRDRLDDPDAAVSSYRAAIEGAKDPAVTEAALSGLRELVASTRDARPLADMLGSLAEAGGDAAAEAALRRERAEVLRYQLGERGDAIAELERVVELEPDDLKAAEDLARLHERESDPERAAGAWRRVLDASPFDVDAYRALVRLYGEAGEDDGAAIVASLLSLVEEGDEETDALARELLERPVEQPQALSPSRRAEHLDHPGTKGRLGALVAAIGVEGAALLAPSGRAARALVSGPFNLETGAFAERVADALLFAVRTLAIPAADLRLAPEGGIAIFEPIPAASPMLAIAPEVVDGMREVSQTSLRFHAARALVGVLPDWYAVRALDLVDLKRLVDASLVVAGVEDLPVPKDVSRLAKRLEKAIPEEREPDLVRAATAYFDARDELDLKDLVEAVELTAVRAGLLVAGSPEAAVRALRLEGEVPRTVLADLVRFSISPSHLALRRHVGITPDPAP